MDFISSKFHPVYISKREAPLVPYEDSDEFIKSQSQFVSSYSKLISEVFNAAFDAPQGNSRLVWTDRDMILYGMADFPDLKIRGVDLILAMTKGRGLAWCINVSSWLADMVTAGCRGHARALMNWPVNNASMNDIYARTLKQEMVSGLYDNLGVFDQLYESSFVEIRHPTRDIITSYTDKKWREMMTAFCMITHHRLGRISVCHTVDSEVICYILMHVTLCTNRLWGSIDVFQ